MKYKFYINGDKERGDEVIAELRKKGGTPDRASHGNLEDMLYYIDNNGVIVYASNDSTFGTLIQETCEEIKLPPNDEYHFESFDKVVISFNLNCTWEASLFSHYTNSSSFKYSTMMGACKFCLPYNDKTKKLIGTTHEWKE